MPSKGRGWLCAGAPRNTKHAGHALEGECVSENRMESVFPINGSMGEGDR